MKITKSYYAGQELYSLCRRCKDETRHCVLSITDGIPEQLICISCKSIHKFKINKCIDHSKLTNILTNTKSPKNTRVNKTSIVESRFQEIFQLEINSISALPYNTSQQWQEGMWLDHPNFGLGKVQKRLGRKIDVLFRIGSKTLISA